MMGHPLHSQPSQEYPIRALVKHDGPQNYTMPMREMVGEVHDFKPRLAPGGGYYCRDGWAWKPESLRIDPTPQDIAEERSKAGLPADPSEGGKDLDPSAEASEGREDAPAQPGEAHAPCPRCGGKGMSPMWEGMTCSRCDGKGQIINMGGDPDDCPKCGGPGVEPAPESAEVEKWKDLCRKAGDDKLRMVAAAGKKILAREAIIRAAALEVDPDCPDIDAYVDGHCGLAEAIRASKVEWERSSFIEGFLECWGPDKVNMDVGILALQTWEKRQTAAPEPDTAPAVPEAPEGSPSLPSAPSVTMGGAVETLREAAEHLAWAAEVEIQGGHRTRAFIQQHRSKVAHWIKEVRAALSKMEGA